MKFLLVAAVLSLASSVVPARELTRGPDASIGFANPTPSSTFLGYAGDYTTAQPTYHIAQWNNPSPLTGATTISATGAVPGDWAYNGTTSALKYISASKTYELSQNPAAALTCNTEFDLFLEPNTAAYPTYKSGLAVSSPLSSISHLFLQVGLKVTYEKFTTKCGTRNGGDWSSYTAALVFRNDVSNQTLFWQVNLRNTLGLVQDNTGCPNYPANGQFCFDTSVTKLGGTSVGTSSRVYNAVDTLPKVKSLISAGTLGLTTDLQNWKLNGAYFGSYVQGGANITSQWDNIRIEEQ